MAPMIVGSGSTLIPSAPSCVARTAIATASPISPPMTPAMIPEYLFDISVSTFLSCSAPLALLRII